MRYAKGENKLYILFVCVIMYKLYIPVHIYPKHLTRCAASPFWSMPWHVHWDCSDWLQLFLYKAPLLLVLAAPFPLWKLFWRDFGFILVNTNYTMYCLSQKKPHIRKGMCPIMMQKFAHLIHFSISFKAGSIVFTIQWISCIFPAILQWIVCCAKGLCSVNWLLINLYIQNVWPWGIYFLALRNEKAL